MALGPWRRFEDLMQSSAVAELADKMLPGGDDFQNRFIAASMLCVPVLPEYEVLLAPTKGAGGPNRAQSAGMALTGGCVFYVADLEDGEPTDSLRPWTFEVGLGSGAWYCFRAFDGLVLNAGDSEDWDPELLRVLARSYWLPLHTPAALPPQR